MKVILVGGGDISKRIPFALGLIGKGINVHLLGGEQARSTINGVKLSGFRMYFGLNLVRILSSLRSLRCEIFKQTPDIVHSFDTIPSALVGLSMMFNKKEVTLVRTVTGMGRGWVGSKYSLLRIFYILVNRVLGRIFDITVFQNPDDMNDFLDYGMVKNSRVIQIPGSGVEADKFKVGSESVLPNHFEADKINVVCITRMLRSKGVPEFLELARISKERLHNYKFYLVGEIDESDKDHVNLKEIEKYAQFVQYLGHRENIVQILEHSSISVLWSSYGEGIPRSLIEACFMGHVVYTLNNRGCRELVLDGVNGRLSTLEYKEEMYSQFIVDCESNYISMKGNAVELIPSFEKKYSLEAIVSQYASVYMNRSA